MPRRQVRVDVCINPATLQMTAARFYRQPPLYSFRVIKDLYVHLPGDIVQTDEDQNALWMKVRPCTSGTYSILICGVKKMPKVTINGAPAAPNSVKFVPDGKRLIIQLKGESKVLLEDL